ncbi:MAG: CPBP family intramembrane glutamic endopeptidase [Sedimentibacter sp.]
MNYQFIKNKKIITLIEIAVVALLSYGVVIVAPILLGNISSGIVKMAVTPLFYVLLAGIPLVAGKITKNPVGPLIFKRESLLQQFLAGLLVFAGTAVLLTLAVVILGEKKYILIGPKANNLTTIIYNIFFFILFVGMGEEILFRGYFMERIKSVSGSKVWSVIITSAVFGFWHFPGGHAYIQVLLTTALGAFYGISLYKVKNCSVLSLGIAHGLYNTYILILSLLLL